MVGSQQIQDIVAGASVLAPEARPAYLDSACAGDAALRAEVESLLRSLDGASAFLANPTAADRAAREALGVTVQTALHEGPGTKIGPYKLLQQIGEGGFGVVFLAEQEQPMRRRVALKIIKLGMDTKQVIAHFEAERQALALMDHPNIARVLDAGATDSGRPYFVMELVKGDPITSYCDTNNLNTENRLDLFVQICHAVQHAHAKGVIHRDIKPSNVLVTIIDGKPVPKVIDFGIAKATAARLTEKTLFTEHRAMIGTPEYMSPEQAEMSGVDVDTRSDVYSLGVLLYELLTGSTPFEGSRLRSAAYGEIQRIIREEEPDKPSTRLSSLKETIGSIAAHRHSEPARLAKLVRGDLDWIVMKCLEKDRTRRYGTTEALADDVNRHLSGEPVKAAPPSTSYRVKKFVRRHKVGVAAGTAITLTLLIGILGTSLGLAWALRAERRAGDAATAAKNEAERAEREANHAKAERDKQQIIAGFLNRLLQGAEAGVARGRDATILRELLDEAAAHVEDGELKDTPEAEITLRISIADTYWRIGAPEEAERILKPALQLAIRTCGAGSLEEGRVRSYLQWVYMVQGRYEEGLREGERSLEISRTKGDTDREIANGLCNVATALVELNRFDEALPMLREALAIGEHVFKEPHEAMGRSLCTLAACMRRMGDPEAALPIFQRALEMYRALYSQDHPSLAAANFNVGSCLRDMNRLEEALPNYEEALRMNQRLYPTGHAEVASSLAMVGSCYHNLGQYEPALEHMEAAVEMYRRLTPHDNADLARALRDRGAVLLGMRDYAGALPAFEESAAMRERIGTKPADIADSLRLAGECLSRLGQTPEAVEYQTRALRFARQRVPAEYHFAVAEHQRVLWDLAQTLDRIGRLTEAEPLHREACDLARSRKSDVLLEQALGPLAYNLIKQSRFADAEPLARETLALRQRLYPDGHASRWRAHAGASLLGECLIGQARDANLATEARLALLREAEPLVTSAYNGIKEDAAVPRPTDTTMDFKRLALERIVSLFETWESLEPDEGHQQEADEWRKGLTSGP